MIKYLKKKMSLTVSLVLFVFFVLLGTFVILMFVVILLHKLGYISLSDIRNSSTDAPLNIPTRFLISNFIFCTFIGTAISGFFSRKLLRPIRKVIAATHQVASGDFDVKVDIGGIDELEELSNSFNKMTEELSSTETLRRDFINNFSHEFKTPIVSIKGFAKILKSGDITETEREEYLDIIISESERLTQLSTQILNLSKYEHMEIVGEKRLYRIDEQIRKIILLLEPKWTAKSIVFSLDLPDTLIEGNEDLIQQVLLNLIDNAIKFSYTGGQIEIGLIRTEKDEIVIKVKDEGCGMSEEAQNHIFEKFYQVDQSHQIAGNGIGLAIVKRLIGLMNGSISVESQVDLGSVFTITLV